MKKFIYITLTLIVVIILFTYVHYYFTDNVGFELMEESEMTNAEKSEGRDWYINNKYNIDEDNLYDLSKVDFKEYSLIISKGMKIKQIKYMKRGVNFDTIFSYIPIFKYKAIKVYIDENSDPSKRYIYLVDDPYIYEDMRYSKDYYTIYN